MTSPMRENPILYEIARETNHALGFPWTDPRTGVTYPAPKQFRRKARSKKLKGKRKGGRA